MELNGEEVNSVSVAGRSAGQELLIRLMILVALIALLVAALKHTKDKHSSGAEQT